MTRFFVLLNLFADIMHPMVFKKWKQLIKGCDWCDFEWHVKNGIKLNFNHLQELIEQFDDVNISREWFISQLKERLTSMNIVIAKYDVLPFFK